MSASSGRRGEEEGRGPTRGQRATTVASCGCHDCAKNLLLVRKQTPTSTTGAAVPPQVEELLIAPLPEATMVDRLPVTVNWKALVAL